MLTILAIGGCLAVAVGWFGASLARSRTSVDLSSSPTGLYYVVDSTDAVVVASEIKAEGTTELDGWTYQTFTIQVGRIVYQADVSLSKLRVGDDVRSRYGDAERSDAPPIAAGATITAHDAIAVDGAPLPRLPIEELDTGTDYVAMLTFVDRRLFPEHPTDWLISLVAEDTFVSTAAVLHPYGEEWTGDALSLSGEYLSSGNETWQALLGPWLAQVDEERQGERLESTSLAVRARSIARTETDPDTVWRDSPARTRPLDPELTPADVLETLETITVLVQIEGDFESGQFLTVRSDMGVSHIAELAAGSHPATLLVRPGAQLEVDLEGEGGGNSVRLGEVAAAKWAASGFGVLTIAEDGSVDFRPVSQEEFAQALDVVARASNVEPSS